METPTVKNRMAATANDNTLVTEEAIRFYETTEEVNKQGTITSSEDESKTRISSSTASSPNTNSNIDRYFEDGKNIQYPVLQGSKDNGNEISIDLPILCEQHRQMNRLAHHYFDKRDYWLHFIPLTTLTFIGGVLSLSSVMLQEKELFADTAIEVFVGILSLLAMTLNTCGKRLNYSARSDMHRTAALEMKRLYDDLVFEEADKESHQKKYDLNPERYNAVFKQIISSCDSVIPDPIFEAFALADSRLKMLLNKNAVRTRINDEFEKNINPLNIIYSAVYSDLYTLISKENRWSWKKMNPEEMVENALENIQKIHLSSENFFLSITP